MAARAGVADVGLVDGDGGGVDGAPGQLGAHGHVGAQVLHRLEPADGSTELAALLGVLDGQLGGPGRPADLEGGGEDGAVSAPPGGDRPARPPAPRAGNGDRPHRGEGIHGTSQPGGVERPRVDGGDAVGPTAPTARRGRRGTRRRRARAPTGGRPALDQTHHGAAVIGPLDQAGGQMGGHQRTGHQRPAQLLEDQGGLGQPQPDARRPPRPGTGRTPRPGPAGASRPGRPPGRPTRRTAPARAGNCPGTVAGRPRPGRSGTRSARSPRSDAPGFDGEVTPGFDGGCRR